MEHNLITAVGVDVSKGKSTIAVRRPGGEVVLTPFQVEHDTAGLSGLVKTLRGIGGDIRVVMEHTGMYWRPIALALKEAGFFVSIVNAMLIHNFSDNSLRKVKTDKADSMKIASYALAYWQDLREYSTEDETRQMLKTQSRLDNLGTVIKVTRENAGLTTVELAIRAGISPDAIRRYDNGRIKL